MWIVFLREGERSRDTGLKYFLVLDSKGISSDSLDSCVVLRGWRVLTTWPQTVRVVCTGTPHLVSTSPPLNSGVLFGVLFC